MPLAMGVTTFRRKLPSLFLNPVQLPDQGQSAVCVTSSLVPVL
jgi:hypothetical protein